MNTSSKGHRDEKGQVPRKEVLPFFNLVATDEHCIFIRVDASNAIGQICSLDISLGLTGCIKRNDVPRFGVFTAGHELSVVVIHSIIDTACGNVLRDSKRFNMSIASRCNVVRRSICKINRTGESTSHITHCAKIFAGISGGARTCTAAFYRKVPACNLACRMLMRRRCESIRVFAIDRIGIAAFHQPVCCQQSHYLLRRKVTFRQCTVCCSLDSRQVGNGLIQQGTQNICDHVELLACWLAF